MNTKTKTGKNVMEMTMGEMRDEIAHLQICLERVTSKNKRRRTALKALNTGMLVKYKFLNDQADRVKYLEGALDTWKRRARLLEAELGDVVNRIVHEGVKVTLRETHGPKVEVKETRRWFNFGRGSRGVSGA